MNGLARALRYLAIEPAQKRSPALLLFRMAQILHERARGRYDNLLVRAISTLHPKVKLPPSRLIDSNAVAATLDALNQRGWDILPWRLDAHDISEIRRFAFSTPAYGADPFDRVIIDEAHIPHDRGRYEWRISELIRLPAVQKLIVDGALHQIAQGYLGCRPILTSVTLWLDPVYEGRFEPHVYHYDNDGPRFLKFFIYLSDVDAESGAHTFIQGSHGHTKPKSYQLSRRYDRDDLLRHYGAENEIVFAAPAGTILAEDTAGFHKGMDLRKGYRLLLQLEFAVFDIPHEEEFSCGIDRVRIVGLDSAIKPIVRKFFI